VHRIQGARRWRVRIEHLDQLIGRQPFDDERSGKTGNAEPSESWAKAQDWNTLLRGA
jgi:hypothetical protein